MTTPTRAEQPTPTELLGAIRWNIYRLTLTTRPTRDDPRTPGTTTATAPPLLTTLRDAIRPNQGRTDSGRSGGSTALPYDHTASTLLTDIEAQIHGMYRSGVEREPIGTAEQLLLEWYRELEYEYRAGNVIETQLTTLLQRIRDWRFKIEDHFTPPRQREFALCPRCGYSHHIVLIDGIEIRQRCVIVTWWPGNDRRPPVAECRREACNSRWIGWDQLKKLDAEVNDNIAEYGPLDEATAPLHGAIREMQENAVRHPPTTQEEPR